MATVPAVSVRDRTGEFLAFAERAKSKYGASTSQEIQPSTSNRNTPTQHTEFKKRAAEIGHNIYRASLKLQRLAQLAKKRSMFDDPAQEVEELTGIIKQDIQGLNTAISDLERLGNRTKDDNKQSQDHSTTVVESLRSKLIDATQEFREVLTLRTENIKQSKERRQLFSSAADHEVIAPLLQKQHSSGASAQSIFGNQASSMASPSFLHQEQQQLVLSNPQDTYMSSRAEALKNVEDTIVELGTIFQKLSTMVAEQGELAIRIDENVDDTLINVNRAQTHLLKYLNTISSNKWLVLKIFLVLLAFLVIFIVFIA